MGADSFYLIMDLIFTACGVYVIYHSILMMATKELRQNMMFPKDLDIKKCQDVPGYIRAVGIRQLVFGIAAMICGLIGIIQDRTGDVSVVVTFALIALFLAAAIWYGVAMKKAMVQFWGNGKKK